MVKVFSQIAALSMVAANSVQGEVYFKEDFSSMKNWVQSTLKPAAERGDFVHTTGDVFYDGNDKGVQTKQDARFYAYSAKLNKPFNNKGKDLFLSYLVKHEQDVDCGGAYVKLLPSDTDQENFGGDSPYSIMFGPDMCGSTRKTHAILHYKRQNEDEGKNMDHETNIDAKKDKDAHLYTFELTKDNKYKVKIDGNDIMSGNLAEKWSFQPAKQIMDPNQSKPKDWVDAAKIPDPSDKKPAGWDDTPKSIPDASAVKPEDWDDEDDGEWEPAMVDNPEYKGEWKAKLIDNPDYKGEWEHPMIDNPDYYEDNEMHNVCKDCGVIGFELWQVKSGTLFDDIIVTDDRNELEKHEEKVLSKIEKLNKHRKEVEDKDAAEKKKLEEEEKAKADTEKVVDDEEDEDTNEKDEL